MCATGLAGHRAGAQWCWWLQMLSPAPLVPESKQERSLKSLFPPKRCLEMTVFIHRDCLFAFPFGSAQPLCLQVVRRSLACWELPLSSSPTLPGAEMGRKTPVASMCWGRGLAWWALQGEEPAPPVPAGSLARSTALCSPVTPATQRRTAAPRRALALGLCRTNGNTSAWRKLLFIAVGATRPRADAGRGARAACSSCSVALGVRGCCEVQAAAVVSGC